MSETWLLTFKPTFLNEMLTLPPKELSQVHKKVALLAQDPLPDAKVKKQLKYWGGKLHRLRSGDFRIFYTFQSPHISVLALRRRDDATYDEDLDPEFLGGIDAEGPPPERAPTWGRWLDSKPGAAAGTKLPRAIDVALLDKLLVDKQHHATLVAASTEEELLDAGNVPDEARLRVLDALCERPLAEVARQPDLVLADASDLLRYKEGELLGFLLKLDPEQEKLVRRGARGTGPTLLKGGPGTGKSTVALYRVRVMLEQLRKQGVAKPRILFTTYTRALTRVSEQLLESLLGRDAALVDVRTADAVCLEIARTGGEVFKFAPRAVLMDLLARAVKEATFEGNSLQVAAQRRTIEAVGRSYLLDEILTVIEARGLRTEAAYQGAPRAGRRKSLTKTQRSAVWRVRERFVALLEASGSQTWEHARASAAEIVAAGGGPPAWDAVVIDEAQDLQPSALRVLVGLCKHKDQLFLTADANQSIYGGSFRWSDVHEDLDVKGRTSVLKANHRSTEEISEAAGDYLRSGVIDPESVEGGTHRHTGPVPAVRAVANERDEAQLLASFFRGATRDFKLGLGSCAVLCPFNETAERIARDLQAAGVPASYTTADNLDLKGRGAKVLTLKNAKGLEFPVVALAGFLDGKYPMLPRDGGEDDVAELLEQERRTMFVAMTRAMRALLVVLPAKPASPLLEGFSGRRWNLGEGAAS